VTRTAGDKARFLRAFIRSPRHVGSVWPSSAHLAEAMLRPVDFSTAELIVELGAGTGVFTELISRRLAPGARALIFERDEAMRRRLQDRYGNLEFHPDALELAALVGPESVDAIVCALPFATFPAQMRARVSQDILAVLRPGGKMTDVQYSLQMRKALRAMFDDVSIAFVPLNVPPAFVYTCTKTRSSASAEAGDREAREMTAP
jgi:phospholipid N-methyltransferase